MSTRIDYVFGRINTSDNDLYLIRMDHVTPDHRTSIDMPGPLPLDSVEDMLDEDYEVHINNNAISYAVSPDGEMLLDEWYRMRKERKLRDSQAH
jgi:hypothetical protein